MANNQLETTITSSQYNQAMRLYGTGGVNGRINFYTYLYGISGSDALLTMAQVSSSSGVLVGGPAWVFNSILQSTVQAYPKGNSAIESFSIAIGEAIKESVVSNGKGGYVVPSDLALYTVAQSVWAKYHLDAYAPPDTEKALTLLASGNFVEAANALSAGTSSITIPLGGGQSVSIGLGFITKTVPEALGLISELTGITRQGSNLYDLMIANPTARVEAIGNAYAVKVGDNVLGVFTPAAIRVGESVRMNQQIPASASSPAYSDILNQEMLHRAGEIEQLGNRLPASLRGLLRTSSIDDLNPDALHAAVSQVVPPTMIASNTLPSDVFAEEAAVGKAVEQIMQSHSGGVALINNGDGTYAVRGQDYVAQITAQGDWTAVGANGVTIYRAADHLTMVQGANGVGSLQYGNQPKVMFNADDQPFWTNGQIGVATPYQAVEIHPDMSTEASRRSFGSANEH